MTKKVFNECPDGVVELSCGGEMIPAESIDATSIKSRNYKARVWVPRGATFHVVVVVDGVQHAVCSGIAPSDTSLFLRLRGDAKAPKPSLLPEDEEVG